MLRWGKRLSVLAVPTCACLALDYKIQKDKQIRKEFVELSWHYNLQRSLDTGDILCFKRTLVNPKPWQTVIYGLSKFVNKDEFDHVAIIIWDREEDTPYVFEYLNGAFHYTDFESRILQSRDTEIVLRKLDVRRSDEMRDKVDKWKEKYLNSQYTMPNHQLIFNLIRSCFNKKMPCNQSRVDNFAKLLSLTAHTNTIEWNVLHSIRSDVEKEKMIKKLRTTLFHCRKEERDIKKRSLILNDAINPKWEIIFPNVDVVVDCLQLMEVLPKSIPRSRAGILHKKDNDDYVNFIHGEYLPRHFLGSSTCLRYIPTVSPIAASLTYSMSESIEPSLPQVFAGNVLQIKGPRTNLRYDVLPYD